MKNSATLHNSFDVQVDSNHTWEEPNRTVGVSVYGLVIDEDGNVATDTLNSILHVEIPNTENVCEDTWFSSENVTDIEALPDRWQGAVWSALELARLHQPNPTMRYGCGETVFLTEHRFPADVEHYTTDGEYVVNMANTGELGVFSESELEPYDAERWHRP